MSSYIKEIRVENLLKVLEDYDTLNDFAEAIDRAPAVASQVKGGRFGDRMARHIESKLGLSKGYFDERHNKEGDEFDELLKKAKSLYDSAKLTAQEKKLVSKFREIDPSKQKLVLDMLNGLSSN